MRGTDCTKEQLSAASAFLADCGWPVDIPQTTPRREEVVALIAWYGALRFIACRDNSGSTLERPAIPITVRHGTGEDRA